jgi:hypothetical protein
MNDRLVFADCETSGIRVDRGSEAWEIALIVRDPALGRPGDTEYLWHLRPSGPMDPESLKIGGYHERCSVRYERPGMARDELRGGREPVTDWAVAFDIASLLAGAHLIGTNPWFDAAHLIALLENHGRPFDADYHYTDIGSLVRGYIHGQVDGNYPLPWPLKLTMAAALVGLNPDVYEAHTALGDARLARDIFDRVCTGGES